MTSFTALARKAWSWLRGDRANPPVDRRTQRLRCKRCGSLDVWRIQADPGWYADFMKARNKKPFECRMCRYMFYFHAERKED